MEFGVAGMVGERMQNGRVGRGAAGRRRPGGDLTAGGPAAAEAIGSGLPLLQDRSGAGAPQGYPGVGGGGIGLGSVSGGIRAAARS
jgi:hypothetical protein